MPPVVMYYFNDASYRIGYSLSFLSDENVYEAAIYSIEEVS